MATPEAHNTEYEYGIRSTEGYPRLTESAIQNTNTEYAIRKVTLGSCRCNTQYKYRIRNTEGYPRLPEGAIRNTQYRLRNSFQASSPTYLYRSYAIQIRNTQYKNVARQLLFRLFTPVLMRVPVQKCDTSIRNTKTTSRKEVGQYESEPENTEQKIQSVNRILHVS